MPLNPPAPRTLKHVRRVSYQGFEREDGLWDIEGELHDSKAYDAISFRDATQQRLAGEAIHHMWLRVTVNHQLVVQAIDVAMDAHPLKGCTAAQAALQQMVGCSMARGWRHAIQKHLGSVASCTHLRELLFNLATAAFQSVPAVFAAPTSDEPPRHLGQCTGWDFNGDGVKQYFPRFYGRAPQVPASASTATAPGGAPLPQTPEIPVKSASGA